MIVVDPRIGSGEYLPALVRAGSACLQSALGFGDFHIPGRGPNDAAVGVGIELKRLSDLLGTIRDGRFVASQLPGLKNTYDVVFLVVEGEHRRGDGGAIEVPRRGGWETPNWARFIGYDSLQEWLLSVELKGGLRRVMTHSKTQTVQQLVAIDAWWSAGWDSHHSTAALDRSYRVRDTADEWAETSVAPVPRSVRVAKEFPGCGNEIARRVGLHFKTARRQALAAEKDFLAVPGIGKKLAHDIYAAWDEE